MSGTIGRLAKVAVSTDGSTYTDIGVVKSANKSSSTDIADDTTNDSNGYKEGVYADQQMSIDVTARYDSTDAGQTLLMDEYYTLKSKIYVRYRPYESTGAKEWKFLATIDDLSVDTSTGDVEEMSFTATSTGTITMSNQT